MKKCLLLILVASLLSVFSCKNDDDATIVDGIDVPDINDLDPPNNGNTEEEEPMVDAISVSELGRLLFYDPILSGAEDVACATCHHPDFGYADGRALSIGIEGAGLGPNRRHLTGAQNGFVKRNSPTIINTAFNGMDEDGNFNPATAPMFWDNRMLSLEAQALGPIESFEEMRGHAYEADVAVETIVDRLQANAEYRSLFASAFGTNNTISSQSIGAAIAAFERTIRATNSPFDQFQAGNQNAMTQAQIRGMNRFRQIGCDNCHSGPMFSDFELHTLGIPDHDLVTVSDDGANGTYAFRTPTLRNLSVTGPYFHNGVGRDLQETIRFYITARAAANNNGGGPGGGGPGGASLDVNPNVNPNQIDEEVRELNNFNNNDIQDIISFIEALDDPDFDRTIPTSVPSGLNPGGNID